MSSALSIVTSLSDYVNNPKFDRYDPAVCKSIHVKLDQETKDKGLSYDERFDAARKNMSVYDKWATVFPNGVAQCLKEYWKERMSSAPVDPRFPNVNQTKRCWINYVDYHRCMESKNDEKVCGYFKHLYKDLCPEEWVNKWDDEMDRGVFPGIHS